MKMTGEEHINASREAVYAALNDAEVLKQCIPGCKELIKHSDTELEAKVGITIGPVKASFSGQVTLSDLNPPESYTISGEGKGGPAGFAKGGATVTLSEDGQATVLSYDVNADVGGKLAQLGSRLIDSTAKKLAKQFFQKFNEIVGAPVDDAVEEKSVSVTEAVEDVAGATTAPVTPTTETPTPTPPASSGETKAAGNVMLYVVLALVAAAAAYFIFE